MFEIFFKLIQKLMLLFLITVTKIKIKSETFENNFTVFLKVGTSYVHFADDQGLCELKALKRL